MMFSLVAGGAEVSNTGPLPTDELSELDSAELPIDADVCENSVGVDVDGGVVVQLLLDALGEICRPLALETDTFNDAICVTFVEERSFLHRANCSGRSVGLGRCNHQSHWTLLSLYSKMRLKPKLPMVTARRWGSLDWTFAMWLRWYYSCKLFGNWSL